MVAARKMADARNAKRWGKKKGGALAMLYRGGGLVTAYTAAFRKH
jgi:hypothetical protein